LLNTFQALLDLVQASSDPQGVAEHVREKLDEKQEIFEKIAF